jgi:hypothetical protein
MRVSPWRSAVWKFPPAAAVIRHKPCPEYPASPNVLPRFRGRHSVRLRDQLHPAYAHRRTHSHRSPAHGHRPHLERGRPMAPLGPGHKTSPTQRAIRSGDKGPNKGMGVPMAVTERTEGRSFTVEGYIPLFRMHFEHTVSPVAGGSEVAHRVWFTGVLAFLFGPGVAKQLREGFLEPCSHSRRMQSNATSLSTATPERFSPSFHFQKKAPSLHRRCEFTGSIVRRPS